MDQEAAKQSLFGGLRASGWHTCAMTMSMQVANMDANGRSLGSPPAANVCFPPLSADAARSTEVAFGLTAVI
nr:hypothetical protein [Sulfitobacter mediterraneus]